MINLPQFFSYLLETQKEDINERLTFQFSVLNDELEDLVGVTSFVLPLQFHRTTADHNSLNPLRWPGWFLHLKLHQLLLITVQVAGLTKIWTTICKFKLTIK